MPVIKNAGFKDLAQTIYHSPALLVTTAVGLGIIGYFFYKSANKQTGGTDATNPSGQSPYYIAYVDETQNQPPPINVTVNPPGGSGACPTGQKLCSGSCIPAGQTCGQLIHAPGSTFRGPSGVVHYVTTGSETLSQIASKFNVGSWNNIYAIPDNQKLFGKLSSTQLRTYKPKEGLVITLPGNARGVPTS